MRPLTQKQVKKRWGKEYLKALEYAKSGLLCPPIGGYKSPEHEEQLNRDYASKLAFRNLILIIDKGRS